MRPFIAAALPLLISAGLACPQTANSVSQTTGGECSPAVVSQGTVTITCTGLDSRQQEILRKMPGLMDQLLKRSRSDRAEIVSKLEQILSDTQDLKATAIQNSRKLAADQQELAATKRYTYIAGLTFNGMVYVKGDVIMPTEISQAVEGTWFEPAQDRFRPVCEAGALQKSRDAIQQFPDFPFTYYAVAYCLQRQGVPEWRSYAEKAISIFEHTTAIGGHQKSHDESLAYLRRLLQQNK